MNETTPQPHVIRRLLVANRGEIARRVFRTARSMGISTVAVYADGDAAAPFVTDADLAVPLGGRTAAETYLSIDKVIAAAQGSGADAVHPGYGFLSENAAFAQAVIDAGLVWVGPPPSAIAAMGDKLAAKEAMATAGVPTLPSVRVGDAAEGGLDADGLLAAAADIGFPVLVKASAGGGGKGMRIVRRPDELADAVAAARREAAGAFGDDTVFLERWLAAPRHVEIQVLADGHGGVVHCFERECSIQRRHQKVIEEAPSPAVSAAVRDQMGRAAVAAASAIGYESAGTVEFLFDDGSASEGASSESPTDSGISSGGSGDSVNGDNRGDGGSGNGKDSDGNDDSDGERDRARFWFLEMNTRLQVEHPVTEAVTGLDLVREQIRIASGEPLGYGQDDLSITGHAVEARLYAEDPASGFLPQTGTVELWAPATAAARFDSGIETGSVVGTEFDPMLAKVITTAPTRTQAALGLAAALDRTRLGGVVTNRDFLCTVLRSDEFLAGDTTTDFIDRVYFGQTQAVAATGESAKAGQAGETEDAVGTEAVGEVNEGEMHEGEMHEGEVDAADGGLAAQEPAHHPMFIRTAATAVALVSQECNRRAAIQLGFMASGYRNSVMPDEVLPLWAVVAGAPVEASVQYRRQRDGSWRMRVGQLPSSGPYAGIGSDTAAAVGDTAVGIETQHADAGEDDPTGVVGVPAFTDWSLRMHRIELRPVGGPAASPPQSPYTGDVDATVDVEMPVPGLAGFRGAWEISRRGSRWYATGPIGGSVALVQRSRFPDADAETVEGGLVAPMPGKVLMVGVQPGDRVRAGQVLVVMEAMKMEHQITAPADGEVSDVRAAVGDQVDNGELLVVITAAG